MPINPPLDTMIVIPYKDKFALTEALLNDLIAQARETKDDPLILLCDHGSSPNTVQLVNAYVNSCAYPNIMVRYFSAKQSIYRMWNEGLDIGLTSGYRSCIILNNDIKIGPDFVNQLVRSLIDGGLVACCPNYDGREMEGDIEIVDDISAGRENGKGGFAGFAFALRLGWVYDTGYHFPEDCKVWFGDNDLMMSLRLTNAQAGITNLTTVEHLDGGSQTIKEVYGGAVPDTAAHDHVAFVKGMEATGIRPVVVGADQT